MDSKGVLRCYEIKVTLLDLKSKAKKSWHGHYNYLFIKKELYAKINDNLDAYIQDYVGVVVPCSNSWSGGVEIQWKAKKQEISTEQEVMLKESMVRSMSYKFQKYREASDLSVMLKLKSELRKANEELKEYSNEASELRFTFSILERALRLYYGLEINLEELTEKIVKRMIFLPEKVALTLTPKGHEYNQKAKEIQEVESKEQQGD